MERIQATPFVPGRARGVLCRGPAGTGAGAGDIVLIRQSDLADLTQRPAGLAVLDAAPLSHPLIRVLGLGIPTVLVTPEQAQRLSEGALLFLDGGSGMLGPAGDADIPAERSLPVPAPGEALLTADGQAVMLRASVGDAQAAGRAVVQGAAAVGLVRSEFLMPPGGRMPDRAFYQTALRALCEAARPLSVTVRLLDLAADKRPAWLPPIAGMGGPLGLQGSRLYGIEPVRRVFRAEVKALGRLLDDFELSVLVPYVAGVDEFLRWRREIEALLPRPVPIGVMAETPAALFAMPEWAQAADFVAVGCNDLMQCLFAADRDLPEVGGLLDPYSPALFRVLGYAAKAAGEFLPRVQVCGLLPQVPGILPVLLGLGYRAFSVEPVLIPHLARIAAETTAAQARALATAVCGAGTPAEVRALLRLPVQAAWALGANAGIQDGK